MHTDKATKAAPTSAATQAYSEIVKTHYENLRWIITPMVERGWTLTEMAEFLEKKRIATVRGGRWTASSASAAVRSLGLEAARKRFLKLRKKHEQYLQARRELEALTG